MSQHAPEHRIALTVVAAFAVVGLVWVLGTDVLLYGIARNPVLIARFETAKGWIFVALSSGVLYAVTLWSTRRLARAQRTVSAIVESIADGVLLLGSDRRIRRANGAATRMLRCDDLVGMDAEEFSRRFRLSYPDGSLVLPHEFISQRVFEEGGPLHYKALLHPPGGSDLVISATAAAVREHADETPSLVVSVMHDITATEHLARLRDEFFAAAAHTLKTPVAIIQAYAQALDEGDGARLVAERIVGAHGGRIGEETVGRVTTAWLTMATADGDADG